MLGTLLEKRVIRDPYWNMWGAGADITPGGDILHGGGVSREQAIRLLTVNSCVKFISDSISMLTLEIFRNRGRNRQLVQPPPRWVEMPNSEQPRQEFVAQGLTSVLYDGNAYSLILRDKQGQVGELWNLQPENVLPARRRYGDAITYEIHQQGVPVASADSFNMMHVKGMSLAGDIKGRNPIQDARISISAGLSLQQFALSFFDNGATVSGVIEAQPGAQFDAAALRQEWDKMHRGAKNANGLAVLTGGLTYKQISINPDDAQFLESRNFTGAEIAAGMFGLHPEMIGLTHGIAGGKDITYQNLESRWVELTRRALQPWMTRFEFAFSNLLPGFATNGQYAKFNVKEYLRADQLQRFQAHQIALGGSSGTGVAWETVDEVRDDEDLPPMPDIANDALPQPTAPPAPAPDQGNP